MSKINNKKLKCFKSSWHLSSDYSLCTALQDDIDFYFLRNYCRNWNTDVRPIPKNAHFVDYFEPNKYDYAVINIDQQCAVKTMGKSRIVRDLNKVLIKEKIPVIFHCHSVPVYPEKYPASKKQNYISEKLRKEILKIVNGRPMIVNSVEASKQWNYGTPIIHGIEDEYKAMPKDLIVITNVAPVADGGIYYNHDYLNEVREILRERYFIRHHWINTPGSFNAKNIGEYKRFVGSAAIYFNPTVHSAMPRSRTEAMLAECCIVSTPNHDWGNYIDNGVNGFIVDNDAEKTAFLIHKLLTEHFELTLQIGKEGRKTALKHFSLERYRKDYLNFIKNNI